MATARLPTDFKEFLQLLNMYEVKYLLVVGYAVGYHEYPRATLDMDIWVDRTPLNAKKLVSVLKKFGFEVDELKETLFTAENKIIRMGVPPLKTRIIMGLREEVVEKGELDRQLKVLSQTDQLCRPIAYQYKKGHPVIIRWSALFSLGTID